MVASPAGYVASGGRLPPLPFSSEDLSWSALFNPVNLLEKNILLIHTLHRKMLKCSGISDSASVRLRAESKRPITPRWSWQPWGEPAEPCLPKFGHLVLFKMPLSVEPSACVRLLAKPASEHSIPRITEQHTRAQWQRLWLAWLQDLWSTFLSVALTAEVLGITCEMRQQGPALIFLSAHIAGCQYFILVSSLWCQLMPRLQRWWASCLWYCCNSLQVKIKLLIVWLSRSCLCTQCFRTASSFCPWFLKPSQP